MFFSPKNHLHSLFRVCSQVFLQAINHLSWSSSLKTWTFSRFICHLIRMDEGWGVLAHQAQSVHMIPAIAMFLCSWLVFCRSQVSLMSLLCSHVPSQNQQVKPSSSPKQVNICPSAHLHCQMHLFLLHNWLTNLLHRVLVHTPHTFITLFLA